ncbi:unnamed protein product, partial [Phaeothamnion confervicola]
NGATINNLPVTLAGTLRTTGGVVALDTDLNVISGGKLRLDGGSVGGAGQVLVASGGQVEAVSNSTVSLSGGITIASGGKLAVNADYYNDKDVTLTYTGPLNNDGTVQVRGGD